MSSIRVSLNDLVTLSDQADVICLRIGVKRGISSSTAAEEMASVFGYEGRAMLEEKLRALIVSGAVQPVAGSVADVHLSSSPAYVRPRLIMDADKLVRVERFLAASAMFQADMSGVEGEQSERLMAYFADKAEAETAAAPVAEGRDLPFVKEALASIAEGGYPEALARVACLLARKGEPLMLSRLQMKQQLK
jgi:hypothetical protein